MSFLVEIGPVVQGDKMKTSIMYFCHFAIISPWKNLIHPFNELEFLSPKNKIWILFTKKCFVTSFVEIGPVILEDKIFKCGQRIFALLLLFHLWKKCDPAFKQNWFPLTFVPKLVEIGQVVLEKNMKMWKVYRLTDRQQEIRKIHLSFKLKWD